MKKGHDGIGGRFEVLSESVTRWTGSTSAFATALGIIVVLTGIFQMAMGLFRLARVASILSPAVLHAMNDVIVGLVVVALGGGLALSRR